MTISTTTGLHELPRTWSQTDPESGLDLRLTDSSLRDGSHHKRCLLYTSPSPRDRS